jgi:DHA2 family multidrug resistance protein-like MFS transporter
LLLGSIGFAQLGLSHEHTALPLVIGALWLYSLGLSPLFTLATNLVVGAAPPERAGAASALSETGAELGGALGVALVGCVGNAVYRRAMVTSIPSGVSASAAEGAKSTLGEAMALAAQLPDAAGHALAASARHAFTVGMTTSAWVCLALVLAMTGVLFALLRRA